MQDLLGMTLLDGSGKLLKHFPDHFFCNEVSLLSALLNQTSDVSSLTVLHDNLYFLVCLVDDAILLLDYVVVV